MSNSRKIASLPNVLTLLDDAGGEFLAQQAAATTTSYTVTWPAAVGGSGALLGTTNSAGAMGWLTALSGLTINNSVIGGSTPAAITGTTVTATSSFVGDITGDITGNADTATTLATPRTFSITGDGTSTFTSFDGSANVSGALTLATVNSNVGSFGSTTSIPVVTVNAKGLVTAVSTASISSTLTVAADSGSDDTITVGTDTLTFAGTANEIETTVSDNQIQFGLSSTLQSTTQSPGDNSTKVATTAYVDTATAALVDSAPSTLDTLNELAAALGDDANFSTTITSSVAAKLPLAGGTMTGDLILGDNVKLEIGAASGGDLQLYHDGSNSYITDQGVGNLRLGANTVEILTSGHNETMATFTTNGAATLYYDNVIRFQTTTNGAYVNGRLEVATIESASNKGVSFGSHILPLSSSTTTDDVVDLGSSSYRFRQIHGVQLFGTVQTAAQPNITSVGTLTGLTVSSAISGSVTGSAGTAATVTGSSQTAITSVGTLSSLAVSGDVTVDTNTLKVDTSNNRVGILNASPDVTLDVGSATDAVHMPVGTTAQRPSSPAAGYIRYNSDTGGFEGYTDSWGEIGGGGGSNTFTKDSFSGDGSTTAFALSQTTGSEDNLIAFIDGVFQTQSAYSIVTASGTTTLTFSVAPPNGTEIIVYSVASAVSGANLNLDTMTGDGSTVAMSLSISAVNENNTQVYFDGVYQSKANYSISGTTLTFSTAPATGVEVEVMTMTQTEINVPVDNTVTAAKLTSDSVTTAKILDDNVTAAKLEHDINLVGNPTTTTQSASDNSTKIATTAYVETAAAAAAAAVVDAAPSTLDTLNELAAALGDDPNFATTVTNSIAAKAPIANPTFTGSFTSPGIDDNADAIAITIDSSENVGIGTGNPHSSGASFTVLNLNGTKGGSLAFSRGTNSATKQWAIRTSDDEDLRFEYGSTLAAEAMRIDSSGNVGIGTDSPNTGLSVVTGSANGIELGQDSDASTDSARLFFSTSAGSNAIHSSSGAMRFFTGSTAGSSTGSERMRISSSGAVQLSAGGFFYADYIRATSDTNTGINMTGSDIISFQTAGSEAMQIDSSGNVNIGSAAGSEKLNVADSITADGYIYPTTDNGWSLGLSTNRWGNVYAYNGNFESTVLIGPGGGVSQLQFYPAFSSGVNLIQNYSGSAYTTEEHRAFDYNFKIANLSSALFINASGGIYSGTTGTSIGSGNIIVNEGVYIGAASGNNQIRSSSAGGGSATLYIGNAAIQVSSDQRLKTNIVDTELNALEKVSQVRVVDFNWDDPSDTSFNNRNARGKWTGVLAQELVDVLPFAVNAPRNESDLTVDTDSEQKWLVDQAQMVPVLIKAIQEQQDLIEALTARITALEGE